MSPDTIRTLTKDQINNALRSIGYNVNLIPLSTSHALVTAARIIEFIDRTDPDTVQKFFESLNGINYL